MNPCHIDINWTNNQTPAINDTNLGQINTELREIDTRVCSLANDPAGEALVSEGWAVGTQEGVPVSSGSPYFENNSDYHRLESEGWANGTQEGVPVSSGPYYQNNAKYWKEQAQAIAGQTLSGLTDVNITTPADGQALVYDSNSSEWVNSDVGVKTTNPNLLINGWFTVNQRGFTSLSAGSTDAYIVDRWVRLGNANVGSVSINSNYVLTIDNTAALSGNILNIRQPLETAYFGKTLTLSVLLSDGTIKSATATAPSARTGSWQQAVGVNVATGVNVGYNFTPTSFSNYPSTIQIAVYDGKSVSIKAIKLEIGSASTLHFDTAPDYSTELLKCQRYFYRVSATSNTTPLPMVAYALNATELRASVLLPVPLRATPTCTMSGTPLALGGVVKSITAIAGVVAAVGNILVLTFTTSGLTQDNSYIVVCGSSGYIDISAEL